MATDARKFEVRYSVAATTTSLPDETLDMLFARAETDYVDNIPAQNAQVKLWVIENLRASAAKLVDYRNAQSEEALGQIFKNLDKLYSQFKEDLDSAVTGGSGIRMGGTVPIRAQIEERPNGVITTSHDRL